MKFTVEFTGGLESYFNNQIQQQLELADGSTVKDLLSFLAKQMSKPDMLLQDGLVRPGVLVLINDQDWELLGEEKYQIQARDNVLFASTLHGG